MASPPHAVKTQSRHAAVELHKSALKRKTLEERQQQARGAVTASPASLEPDDNTEVVDFSSPAANSGGGLTRSRRWFGKLDRTEDQPQRADSSAPAAPPSRARSYLDDSASAATQPELDGYATPRAPAPRKKASYAALPVLPGREAELTATAGPETGYASLQDVSRAGSLPARVEHGQVNPDTAGTLLSRPKQSYWNSMAMPTRG